MRKINIIILIILYYYIIYCNKYKHKYLNIQGLNCKYNNVQIYFNV